MISQMYGSCHLVWEGNNFNDIKLIDNVIVSPPGSPCNQHWESANEKMQLEF